MQAPGPHLGKLGFVLLKSSLSLILLFNDDLCGYIALFNPETSALIQQRHPYTGNLNSETPGDSQNVFLYCGDVLVRPERLATPCE